MRFHAIHESTVPKHRSRERSASNVSSSHASFVADWFGAKYQNESNAFPVFAVDAVRYLTLYPEFTIAPAQRELWARTILDASYLMNFIGRDGYTKNLNMMDPRLSFKYRDALSATVPNPFFNYGTVDTFPGALRTRPTVAVSELLKPYPQYLSLMQDWTNGRKSKYHTLELRAQRPFVVLVVFLALLNFSETEWQASVSAGPSPTSPSRTTLGSSCATAAWSTVM